jgi:hypothetical protein
MGIMTVAVGIGALLLGGWVMNTPVDKGLPDAFDQMPREPAVEELVLPEPAPARIPSARTPQGPPSEAVPEARYQDPRRMLSKEETELQNRQLKQLQARAGDTSARDAHGKRLPKVDAKALANAQKRPLAVMPPLPTEPVQPGMLPMPSAPTSRDADLNLGPPVPADQFASPTAQNRPGLPMSRRAGSPRGADSPTSYAVADQMRQATEAAAHPVYAPQAGPPPKAFATARPFSSGVSPYMQLFRNDTSGGTIDNYSTFVRPALDQRSLNQQFNMDVYGLQRNAQIQNAALQQLNRNASRVPQSIVTPQFMNYGNYYPSYWQGQNQPGFGP